MGRNPWRTSQIKKFEQLSFEDMLENRLEIGDLVKVIAKPQENQVVETFYYLKEFYGKEGELTRIIFSKNTSFEVSFEDGTKGYFYENEISKIGGSKKMKLSEARNQRIVKLKERNDYLDEIILGKIRDHSQPLPINLILEARFNSLMIAGIKLENEIKYLEDQDDEDLTGIITVKKRRLDMIKGQINELNNVADMLNKYDSLGREFNIIRI